MERPLRIDIAACFCFLRLFNSAFAFFCALVDDVIDYIDVLTAQIEAGDAKELFDYLEEAIEEGDEHDEIIIRAKKLLRKLQNYEV